MCPERRVVSPLVQPRQKLLEMDIDPQVPRLVDDPSAGAELSDLHLPATAMRIAQLGRHVR